MPKSGHASLVGPFRTKPSPGYLVPRKSIAARRLTRILSDQKRRLPEPDVENVEVEEKEVDEVKEVIEGQTRILTKE